MTDLLNLHTFFFKLMLLKMELDKLIMKSLKMFFNICNMKIYEKMIRLLNLKSQTNVIENSSLLFIKKQKNNIKDLFALKFMIKLLKNVYQWEFLTIKLEILFLNLLLQIIIDSINIIEVFLTLMNFLLVD